MPPKLVSRRGRVDPAAPHLLRVVDPVKPYCKAKMIGDSVYSYYMFCGSCDARFGGLGYYRMRYCPFCATPIAKWTWDDGYEKVSDDRRRRLAWDVPDPDFYDAGDGPKERPDVVIDGSECRALPPVIRRELEASHA